MEKEDKGLKTLGNVEPKTPSQRLHRGFDPLDIPLLRGALRIDGIETRKCIDMGEQDLSAHRHRCAMWWYAAVLL